MSDMYRNGIVGCDRSFVPDRLEYLIGRKNSTFILEEKKQNVIFNGSKLNLLSVNGYTLALIIDAKSSSRINVAVIAFVVIAELGISS